MHQLSLFASTIASPTSTAITTTVPSTSILGLLVTLPKACRACGSPTAVIGSSAAMHRARLNCGDCNRHRGWLSAASFAFITETVEHFGRTVAPIIVRKTTFHEGN